PMAPPRRQPRKRSRSSMAFPIAAMSTADPTDLQGSPATCDVAAPPAKPRAIIRCRLYHDGSQGRNDLRDGAEAAGRRTRETPLRHFFAGRPALDRRDRLANPTP